MKIYYFPECPFCQRVLAKIKELGIEDQVELVVAYRGTPASKEVRKLGGKVLVPFLVDGDVMMYESAEINKYLEEKFN